MIARTYPHALLLRPQVTAIFTCDLRSREQASRQHAGLQPDHDTQPTAQLATVYLWPVLAAGLLTGSIARLRWTRCCARLLADIG